MDKLVIENGIGNLYQRSTMLRAINSGSDAFAYIELRDGERLARPYQSQRHGTLYNTHTIGSVVGYAVERNDDPFEAVERARKNGHELVYIFANGAIIHNGPRSTEKHILVEIGMVVRFLGKFYTIVEQPNNNLGLKPYEFTV